MYRDRFEGNWQQFGGEAKEQLGRRANDPPCEFTGRIVGCHRISDAEATRQLDDFFDCNRNWLALVNR